MTDRFDEVTPSERVAVVTRELVLGKRLTPAEVAELTECDLSTAYKVLKRISRVVPIFEDSGRWATVDLNLQIE